MEEIQSPKIRSPILTPVNQQQSNNPKVLYGCVISKIQQLKDKLSNKFSNQKILTIDKLMPKIRQLKKQIKIFEKQFDYEQSQGQAIKERQVLIKNRNNLLNTIKKNSKEIEIKKKKKSEIDIILAELWEEYHKNQQCLQVSKINQSSIYQSVQPSMVFTQQQNQSFLPKIIKKQTNSIRHRESSFNLSKLKNQSSFMSQQQQQNSLAIENQTKFQKIDRIFKNLKESRTDGVTSHLLSIIQSENKDIKNIFKDFKIYQKINDFMKDKQLNFLMSELLDNFRID